MTNGANVLYVIVCLAADILRVMNMLGKNSGFYLNVNSKQVDTQNMLFD